MTLLAGGSASTSPCRSRAAAANDGSPSTVSRASRICAGARPVGGKGQAGPAAAIRSALVEPVDPGRQPVRRADRFRMRTDCRHPPVADVRRRLQRGRPRVEIDAPANGSRCGPKPRRSTPAANGISANWRVNGRWGPSRARPGVRPSLAAIDQPVRSLCSCTMPSGCSASTRQQLEGAGDARARRSRSARPGATHHGVTLRRGLGAGLADGVGPTVPARFEQA